LRPLFCGQALALVFTFGSSQPGTQSLVLTLLCFLFVVAHCILKPMWNTAAQTLQTILLSSLTLVALSCTVTALGTGTTDPGSSTVAQRMQVACGVVVPLAAFAWAHLGRARSALQRAAYVHLSRLGRV
jgi:hypothetical protein